MKANELRYGNKLFFLGEIVTFRNILDFREDGVFWIETIDANIRHKNFHFKPIPLTEEWLLKFGFEWSIQHQAHKHEKFKYVVDFYDSYPQFDNSVCFLNKEHRSGENLICIQYVHQLQNLYFSLTGQELTFKDL